jgi:hypothetical protein
MTSENMKSRRIETLDELCGAFFSEGLVRQVQEQGFMLPATVKLGSQVLEVYTPLDEAAGESISSSLEEGMSLCEAIEGAEWQLIYCYAQAEGKNYDSNIDFSERRDLLSKLRVKKLMDFKELGNALGVDSDSLAQLIKTCGCKALSLITPWGAIPFYREEEYLMLRYAKRLILEEGVDAETALQEIIIPFYDEALWCHGE